MIIDDVQFFNRAEKSQDAFFAIFNHLHQSGKQLVLTSDKAPKDLEGLQEIIGKQISAERNKNGLYKSMEDFINRIPIGVENLQTLIFVGAFRFTGKSKNELIIDVRAPIEFFKGHVPYAINIPLFEDSERAEIGTLYKQQGKVHSHKP